MKLLVKCQRSLSTNMDRPHMLFYTRGHDIESDYELTEAWNVLFEQTGYRFFAYVTWPDQKQPPQFISYAGEQGW